MAENRLAPRRLTALFMLYASLNIHKGQGEGVITSICAKDVKGTDKAQRDFWRENKV